MSSVNALLNARLKKSDQSSSKMTVMAKQSVSGNLTSFAGIFSVSDLSISEKAFLQNLLQEYATGQEDLAPDLRELTAITCEVKAINNQAALLHGERIKKAHAILTSYRDGAFTAWLIVAYGNRQTPYNFLQYYEFCEAMPKLLRPQIEAMPRQAVYTLASREGTLDKKRDIVEGYNGETKTEILRVIRETFPLSPKDRRRQDIGETAIQELMRLQQSLDREHIQLTMKQKKRIEDLLESIKVLVQHKV